MHLRKNNLLSKKASQQDDIKEPQPESDKVSRQHTVDCYEDFQLIVQELDVSLEQQIVLVTWDLQSWWNLLPNVFGDSAVHEETVAAGGYGNSRASKAQQEGAAVISELTNVEDDNRLYIDMFSLHPIKINVSFVMSPGVVEPTRRRTHGRSLLNFGTGVVGAFFPFLRQLGEVVLDLSSSISNAPIFISGMLKDHLFMSTKELKNSVLTIYFHSVVTQVLGDTCLTLFVYRIHKHTTWPYTQL